MIAMLWPIKIHAEGRQQSLSLRTFDEVWQTVNESYYDKAFGGLDWEEIGDEYRKRAEDSTSAKTLRPILNDMLAELGESHFGVIPSYANLEDSALVQEASTTEEVASEGNSEPNQTPESQADDEEPSNRKEVASNESNHTDGDYSGVHLRLHKNMVIVSAVDIDSPAAKAGVAAGMVVTKIGKLDVTTFIAEATKEPPATFSRDFFILSVLGELTGAAEDDQQSLLVREPNKSTTQTIGYRPIAYPGKMSKPFANMPPLPLRFNQNLIAAPNGELLYVAFNTFLPDLMPELRKTIRNANKEQVIGLIIDLRGNLGGVGVMANGLAGILTDEQFSLGQMTMRDGHINFIAYPQKKAFLGPVAVLVDRMSASTSEIFAAGLQERGRAKIIGRRTMGAALPSFIRELPNGDRLQHAIADYHTPEKRRIEGQGVIPDFTVELRPKRLRRGLDADLDRAVKWLNRQTSKAPIKQH